MPATAIELYHDDPAERRELAEYLVTVIADPLPVEGWLGRFAHWWDENPYAGLHEARGWVVRKEGRLAGFLALIPVGYSVKGKLTPGLAASTWVIDPECRNVSLPMFMKLRRLGQEILIADTTPSPEVQALMDRSGWRAERWVTRRFFSRGRVGRGKWPALAPGLRCVTSLDEVRSMAQPKVSADRLEKWRSVESLRWQLASPMHGHRFLGAVDAAGVLSSFLVLVKKSVRGVPAWAAMEAWTARDGTEELQAMTGAWLTDRAKLDLPWRPLFSAAEFASDEGTWSGAPALHSRKQAVCHFFSVPPELAELPKQTVMAEGDLGL